LSIVDLKTLPSLRKFEIVAMRMLPCCIRRPRRY
jgi:hypothetical protein